MAAVSKLEYLKRYMDDAGSKDKKKKKKKLNKINNVKIIDNAITFKDIDKRVRSEDEAEFEVQEEKPLLYADDGATIITEEYKENERKNKAKWNPLSSKNKTESINNNSEIFAKGIISTQNKRVRQSSSNQNYSSDSDMSPVRQQRTYHNSSDSESPVCQRRIRHDSSDSDISPVRQPRLRHDSSDSDISPLRHDRDSKAPDSDLSTVRDKRGCSSENDLSPPREINNSRRSSANYHANTKQVSKRKELIPEILSTGKKVGLSTVAELREENELKRKREMKLLRNLHSDVSGKEAETVYRDRKSGKMIDVKLEEINKRKQEEDRLIDVEKYAKWGKGVAQIEGYKQRLEEDLQEMEKPMARYKDDKDLDNLLKDRERDGDPMLAYINKSKNKEPKSVKPRYNGPTPPPNRFNIWPGYRYDGVDRSNGFEKRRFLEINKRKTVKDAAYKWSVEEM